MRGLGHAFDVCSEIVSVADLAAGANTGHRIHMRNYQSVAFVLCKGVASAGTDSIVITLQEHTAATSGTSQNLAAITDYYVKSEASLDGDETWTETTQAAAATLTLTGATYATLQALVVFEVEADSLSAGYQWVSVNIADPGSGGTIPGTVIAIPSGLKIRRNPSRLVNPNT